MSSLRQIPLGDAIPDRPHAISVSLPTMADLIGYEEKDPAVLRHVPTGYPRFVTHPYLRTLTNEFARRHGLQREAVWLVATPYLAERMRVWLGGEDVRVVHEGEVSAIAYPPDPDRNARAKAFLQHCGGFLSSRHAEDLLVAAGLVPAPAPERCIEVDPAAEVKNALAAAFTGARADDLFLAASGMNAIHAAFRASNAAQAPRGRTVWIQLGWLYLDTIATLQKFTADPENDYVAVPSVTDLSALRQVLAERGARVAGIITEVPTNPLVQCCNVPELAELARAHGAHLVLDASIASPWNVDVLGYADMVVVSLTKYAASEGDLLAGVVAVNPAGGDAAALGSRLSEFLAPPYSRDLGRLAFEIGETERVLSVVNQSTVKVAGFLEGRSEVCRVHWALADGARANYAEIARRPDAVGSMISIEVRPGAFAAVYDRLRLPKGPSFGMRNSLCCPFLYLAHYDLVTAPPGRARLAEFGLNPELLRLSMGTEPVDEILAVLAEALEGA